ncbi:MAG: lipoate--protein ligase family protein [Bacteroidaceae bacterium]|nr:lipoate--protein ligase family protein [Bacteroidaceae bacterium]
MKYVTLPETLAGDTHLSFYLAMEEYVARNIDESDCFFMWQVEPTVIFGRNQVLQNEVNTEYCRQYGIELFRRKSGGGCVYADKNNIMLSFITKSDNVLFTFNRFMTMLIFVLQKLGVEAVGTTHNDVMIGDKKVCGTAFYQLPGRSIVHSTMLYDTNIQHMQNAITPSAEKLQKKGIESVRQRITFLKDYISLNIAELKAFIRQTLCDSELQLMDADVEGIRRIEQEYLDREFIQRM